MLMTPINSGHLIWWLRQQFDADEAVARTASGGDGYREWDNPTTGVVQLARGDLRGLVQAPREAAIHIARHDPASVLADVAAKRRIVEWCEAALNGTSEWASATALAVLRELATGLADRDGYDETWSTR